MTSGNGSEALWKDDQRTSRERTQMVDKQLRGRDIDSEDVLSAMQRVPRHLFVPPGQQKAAYTDAPLPIGHGQTISQPYIVALMTQLVRPSKGSRALDVGTGSGYQAAVLAELAGQVYSIERVPELALTAAERLQDLGYRNVEVRCGDGSSGWPEAAPYDAIIAAAAPERIPPALIDQLAPGGRLVIPVGGLDQDLILVEKRPDGRVVERNLGGVRFVPMR